MVEFSQRAPRQPGSDGQETGRRESALQGLHDRHAPELWRFAMRLTRDPQVAEDLVQEALLRAWRDPGLADRSEQASRAWLFTVVRNLVVDRWRSAAARHEVVADELVEPSIADRSGEVLDRWLVGDALRSLTRQHRHVIAAAYYEGRSVADIAAELRIPEGTVKSRLHYGLRSLRLALQEKGVTQA
ncbi:MAG TPA: sigma-70 family RNA polymerase sigma factor [Pedococcus sp.]|nr:sigma-70 family RNA polymerase sigma factor [Pedococcus sp.]